MTKIIRLSTKQVLAAGFALIILIGCGLLMLPAASMHGEPISFLKALFTSASATCVTGLVVFDTYTQFTFFGQLVILILIQIGGLGFMTVAMLFSMALGKRIGLTERSYLAEAVCAMQLGGVIKLVRRILVGTLICEGAGTLLLATRLIPALGFWRGLWFSLFHSISAFCNAGFDLMGTIAPYGSLAPFAGDLIINTTVMLLILVGGIGFVVWDDLIRYRQNFRQYSLHTKLALTSSVILVAIGAILFFLLENGASLAGRPVGEKILVSLFQSVTPRTAGFSTIDTSAMSEGGSLLTMLLMFIGASPGSTGGGIKTVTMAVLLLAAIGSSQKLSDVSAFNRRVNPIMVRQAFSVTAFHILLVITGSIIITAAQSLNLKDVLFETISAVSTVGLSTGITSDLSVIAQLVIILLMYAGRVGSLTVIMAVSEKRKIPKLRDPEGKLIIG